MKLNKINYKKFKKIAVKLNVNIEQLALNSGFDGRGHFKRACKKGLTDEEFLKIKKNIKYILTNWDNLSSSEIESGSAAGYKQDKNELRDFFKWN